jgi:glycosyltransferase involved in cell wall biosynthesis
MANRVLIFSTTYFPLVGGAEVAMNEITNRISDVQFDLVCARIRPGLASKEKIGNVTVHRVGFGHPVDKVLLPILGAWHACRLGSANDLPLAWGLMASYGGLTALTYCWMRPKTRFLLSLQEGDPLEHYAKRAGVLNFLHRAVFKRADAVQAISHFLANWSTKMGFDGTPEVVPNGVDIETFAARISEDRRAQLRQRHGFGDEDVVLVTASRLSFKNGVDDLIRAIAKLPPEFKLLIAGEGEDRGMLEAEVANLNIASRVVFHGITSHDDLPALLQASDIFVRASRSEGLGNSFLEAMAAGIPIVGTNVGGIPDFLTDGETGVFCLPNNPDSIAMAVSRIAHDADLRAALITNGERLVRERYNWDDIAQKMREVLTRTSIV